MVRRFVLACRRDWPWQADLSATKAEAFATAGRRASRGTAGLFAHRLLVREGGVRKSDGGGRAVTQHASKASRCITGQPPPHTGPCRRHPTAPIHSLSTFQTLAPSSHSISGAQFAASVTSEASTTPASLTVARSRRDAGNGSILAPWKAQGCRNFPSTARSLGVDLLLLLYVI